MRALLGAGLLCTAFFADRQDTLAQVASPTETPQPEVVLIKLAPPVYPPLARQARIMGDVKVQVLIHKDGSIESAEALSGHPILKQAALDSAQKSTYECRGCKEPETSYSLTYTFGFRNDGGCADTIEERPSRSPKCLYLWKCGVKSISTWHRPENLPPEVTRVPGHVTILASSVCVEPMAAH
jgi:TonB family protein